jgi:hypothetical protein
MSFPMLSTVTYIDDIGGPTLILDQITNEAHSILMPLSPSKVGIADTK